VRSKGVLRSPERRQNAPSFWRRGHSVWLECIEDQRRTGKLRYGWRSQTGPDPPLWRTVKNTHSLWVRSRDRRPVRALAKQSSWWKKMTSS